MENLNELLDLLEKRIAQKNAINTDRNKTSQYIDGAIWVLSRVFSSEQEINAIHGFEAKMDRFIHS